MSWSSVLSVGVDGSAAPVVSGFSLWSGLGSLSGGPRFELGGTKGRVLALMDYGDGLLLSLSAMPGSDFSLVVDGEQFAASQSLVPSLPGRARFWWPLDRVLWSEGDEVDVELRVVAGGSALGARAAAPPWAWLRGFPGSHEGAGALWVDLLVSEPVAAGAGEVRGSVRVIGGALDRVQRRDSALGDRWGLKVVPDGDGDVTVWLDTSQGCAALGWWCTGDGRDVHNSPQFTVAGPASATLLDALGVSDAHSGNPLDLDSAFDPARALHTAYVPDGTEAVTVHAAAAHPDATVGVSPADADPDADGHQVAVASGAQTVITVTVTAGTNTDTYWLVVDHGGDPADAPGTRSAQPARSGLSGLAVDGVDPISFDPQTHRYELPAPTQTHSARTHTVVTGLDDTDATVEVLVVHGNDTALGWDPTDADPDTPGHQITLADRGDTLILIRVTSTNGRHQQIYALLIQTPQTQSPTQTPPPAQRQSHRPQSPTQTLTHKLDGVLGPASLTPADTRTQTLRTAQQRTVPQLASLTLTGAELAPPFAPATTDYTATAAHDTARVTVDTAVGLGTMASVTPADADPNTPGHQIDLAAPEPGGTPTTTAIAVAVRTTDNQLTTYTITVTRQAPPGDDASLSALGVDAGTLDPVFAPGNRSYTVEVDADVGTATVTATPADAQARVIIEPPDSDADTIGHQVDLDVGLNRVVVEVESFDGTDEQTYTLVLKRPSPHAFGWNVVRDIDTLSSAGNEEPAGIWSDGTTVWVTDRQDHKVYAYDLASGVRVPGKDANGLWSAGNRTPTGLWSDWPDGPTLWVTDNWDAKIYAYQLSTLRRNPERDIDGLRFVDSPNVGAHGLWSDGTTIWVADYLYARIYAYVLATGARDHDKDIDSLAAAGNEHANGIWSDGSTLWVTDLADDKLYAYDLVTGDRLDHFDFNTLGDTGNSDPRGIWSDGTHMWVVDDVDERIYVYNMPPSSLLSSLQLSGIDIGFGSDQFDYTVWVPHSVASTTVTAVAADSDASIEIAPADAQALTDEHEVDLSAARNTVTITVTNGDDVTVYTVEVNVYTDDYAADVSTSGAVAADDVAASGGLQFPGDRDWFRIELDDPGVYRFDLRGADSGGGTLADPRLAGLRDSAGAYIAGSGDRNSGVGNDSRVWFYVAAAGTYFVDVRGSGMGTYTLTVHEPAEVASDVTTTGTVTANGSPVTGVIQYPGDVDWYRLELAAPGVFQVEVQGADSGSGTLADPHLDGIYGSDGQLIAGTGDADGGIGADSRILIDLMPAGTYFVAVRSGSHGTGSHRLIVRSRLDNLPAVAGTAQVGGPAIDSSINAANTQSRITVDLEAGHGYRVYMSTSAGLSRAVIAGVYSPQGRLLSDTHRSGTVDVTLHVNAAEAGEYSIVVGPNDQSTGSFSLQVTEFADDHPAYTTTAATAAVGGATSKGVINFGDDRDWFAVTLAAGQSYQFDVLGLDSGGGSVADPLLAGLYDDQGVLIGDTRADGGGRRLDSRLVFVADSSGVVFVSVGAVDNGVGSYSLRVTTAATGATGDSSTLASVAVGGAVFGTVDTPGEVHWYSVELEGGVRYRFSMEGRDSIRGRLRDPRIVGVYGSGGSLIAGTSDDDSGVRDDSRVFFVPSASGTHYVAVGGEDAHEGTYVLRLQAMPALGANVSEPAGGDVPADTSTTARVLVGGSVTASSDVIAVSGFDLDDWFAVELEEGFTYRFEALGAPAGGGTATATSVSGIYDAQGTPLIWSRYGHVPNRETRYTDSNGRSIGSSWRIDWAAPYTGTYYVRAGAKRGTYTLRVSDAPISDDYSADTATAGYLMVDSVARGRIEIPGDVDWFETYLEAGQPYDFRLEGMRERTDAPRHESAAQELIVGIYDSAGAHLDGTTSGVGYIPDWPTPQAAELRFVPQESGVHYIAVGQEFYDTGAYELSASAAPIDVPANASTNARLPTGTLVRGLSSATGPSRRGDPDEDWWRFTATAGTEYGVMMMSREVGLGSREEPMDISNYVDINAVYDSNGDAVASRSVEVWPVHVFGGSLTTFTAAEAGVHYIAAKVRDPGGYWLDAFEMDDDHPADVSTSGTVAVGGSTRGVISTEGDQDWYAVELVSGNTYRFWMQGFQTRSGSLADPQLKGVFDSAGDRLAPEASKADIGRGRNRISQLGHNSKIVYTAAVTGTHYISAGASPGRRLGSYVLQADDITGVGVDDFTASRVRPGRIELRNGAGGANGTLHSSDDDDWFAVDLVEGHRYKIETRTARSRGGTLRWAEIVHAYDRNGRPVPNSAGETETISYFVTGGSSYSQDGRLALSASYTGTYYIQIGTYSHSSGYKGTYAVVVTDLTETVYRPASVVDDFAADTSTSGVLAVGAAAAGAVNRPHDRDWFAVDLVSGTTYRFDLSGAGTAAPLGDPFIAGLFDSGGAYVGGTTNDDRDGSSSDSRVTFTASATGTYYLAVGSYTAELGDYEVTVAAAAGS